MSSTAGSSRMGCGFPSTSRPPRAPPSAAWWATIPAARARCATATRARTCCRSTRCSPTERWRISARLRLISRTLRPLRRSCRSRAISLCSLRARPTRSRRASPRCTGGAGGGGMGAGFARGEGGVGGYNLDSLLPGRNELNLAHILVGSEGTLAFSTRIELKLAPLLGARAIGACHFGSFVQAMEAAQHIVKLAPIAVELIDRTMLGLARDIAMFRPTIETVVRGDPEAILFVQFAEDDQYHNLRRLMQLKDVIGALGLGWDKLGAKWGGVVEIFDPKLQAAIGETRTAGLNIMMSMKEEGKPVSFVEDCAVPLEHLAEYTSNLTDIFAKHRTP